MKKSILIIEDEHNIAQAQALILEDKFNVHHALDGEEGLKKAQKIKPDLIILDLMLPKIDGYKVCRLLKFDEKYKNIPVIMLTARAQESDKKLGLDVGADAYIVKPFEPDVLLSKIKELLKE